jgi:hypothetical protein
MTPFEKLSYNEHPLILPPADAAPVKLQDDEALVEKAALICALVDEWSDRLHCDVHKRMYRRVAKEVLALVDDLQGQRIFKVTMPKTTDDAATLRAMFGEPDPGLGPQLRDHAAEIGAIDVLNDHFRQQRT